MLPRNVPYNVLSLEERWNDTFHGRTTHFRLQFIQQLNVRMIDIVVCVRSRSSYHAAKLLDVMLTEFIGFVPSRKVNESRHVDDACRMMDNEGIPE